MTESSQEAVGQGATRRAVILGVGVVGAAGVLAACGGGDPSETPTNNPPAGGNTSPGQTTTTTAAASEIKVADIPVGGGKVYGNLNVVVTQPTAGDIKAFDATCTHMGCQVGGVSGGRITCPCHGSQFNITDGSVAMGPNTGQPLTRGLAKLTLTVNGDSITIG